MSVALRLDRQQLPDAHRRPTAPNATRDQVVVRRVFNETSVLRASGIEHSFRFDQATKSGAATYICCEVEGAAANHLEDRC
jgi:hypothetical protein